MKAYSHALVPIRYNVKLKKDEGGIIRNDYKTTGLYVFPGVIDNDCEGRLCVFCTNCKEDSSITMGSGDAIARMERFKIINYNGMFDVAMRSIDNINKNITTNDKITYIKTVRKIRGTGVFGSTSAQKGDSGIFNKAETSKETMAGGQFSQFDVLFVGVVHRICEKTIQF